MYMPLGNLYLSAVAKQAGYEVHIADFRERIGVLPEAKYYGFSCTTPQIGIAKGLAKGVKGKTIVGGAHPSLLPKDCIDSFDHVVVGEGEEVLLDILRGEFLKVIYSTRNKDLDSIPFPDWDGVGEPFSNSLYTGERYGLGDLSMAVITSRGCPYNCSFCGNIYCSPVIFRSVGNIISELMELMKRGVNHYRFVDDNFTLHPDLKGLCRELSRYNLKYRCHTRSNLMSPIIAEWLKSSGCEECCLGIESADDSVLKLNKKHETVAQHKEAIQILKKAGLRTKLYWMSGLPGETDKSIELNMQFMKELKPEKWTLSTFTPYPGCEIFNNPKNFGVTITNHNWDNWWNFVFNVGNKQFEGREGYVHIFDGQTPEEMKARHDRFYHYLLQEEWK